MNKPGSRSSRDQDGWTSAIFILKVAGALSGALLAFTGIYSLYPLSETIRNLPTFTLKWYCTFFGLTILLIEGKSILPPHHSLRQWFYTEFHFLATARGKSFYYLLIACLTLALCSSSYLFLICGSIVLFLACVTFVASFAKVAVDSHGVSPLDFSTATQTPSERRRHKTPHREHEATPLITAASTTAAPWPVPEDDDEEGWPSTAPNNRDDGSYLMRPPISPPPPGAEMFSTRAVPIPPPRITSSHPVVQSTVRVPTMYSYSDPFRMPARL